MGRSTSRLTRFEEFDPLDPVDTLVRLIYSEARGESQTGKAVVVWVVSNQVDKNRTVFGGNTYKGVYLKKMCLMV